MANQEKIRDEISPSQSPALAVYYDRSCPMCRTEIEALDLEIPDCQLRDCSVPGFDDPLARLDGVTTADMMNAMHVRDADGRWWRGVDAFVLLYRSAGRQRVASWLARPALRPIWDRLYPIVARNRQWMSRLGLHRPFGALLRRTSRRQHKNK